MAIIDKTMTVIFCPLCGAAKESDVFIEEMDSELGPKFYCGTVVWPFQKRIKIQGEKCRILQKMRASKPADKLAEFINLGKNLS